MSRLDLLEREKYKIIPLGLPDGGAGAEIIETVNARFSPEDLHIIRNGGRKAQIWLRQVDLDLLRVILQKSAGKKNPHFARDVLESIEKIKSYGVVGGKRLYVGYGEERKVADRKGKELRRGRHYYANDSSFADRNADIPGRFKNTILCGDSGEVLKQLPDNCIDLVFTSPPYNFGMDYRNSGDAYDWESYFERLFGVFDECIRILKYGGRIIVNVQPLFSDYIPSHHIISNYFLERKMIWRGEIMWEKNNYNCKYTAWGSWKSPSSPYLKYTWEFLEVFCKGDLKKSGDRRDADIDADSFKRWVYGRWSIAPERKMNRYGHPAMFPEELARRAILLFSFRGDVVLDPFAGVGTTCVAAKRNRRDYLGIEIVPEYCRTAGSRLAQTG